MKLKSITLGVLGTLALGASTLASAQDSGYGRWDSTSTEHPRSWIPGTSYGYVGASVGESDYDLNCAAGFSCDSKDTGFKIFTGGKLNHMLGLELAYIDFGNAGANGGETEAQALNLSLVGSIPLGERFSVFAKVGGDYAWTDVSSTTGVSGDENDFGWNYGAGVQFDINRKWAVLGEFEHHRIDFVDRSDDVALWSVGAMYKF